MQSKNFRASIIAMALIPFGGLLPVPGHALTVESGIFVDEIERLRDLTFDSGSNLYVAPTAQNRTDFAALATSLYSGDIVTADAQANALDYELGHLR
jgi:hypothetical protein